MFIHSPAEGHLLRCFQVLAVMNEFSFYKHLFDFPGGSNSRESTCNAGDLDLIPALGRSPGGGNGNPLRYSCLGNLMDSGAWWATVQGVQRVRYNLATKQQQQINRGNDKAAAAAKSHQSCLTLCDPIDGSPPGSPIPGILQARTLEWVAISFSNASK